MWPSILHLPRRQTGLVLALQMLLQKLLQAQENRSDGMRRLLPLHQPHQAETLLLRHDGTTACVVPHHDGVLCLRLH